MPATRLRLFLTLKVRGWGDETSLDVHVMFSLPLATSRTYTQQLISPPDYMPESTR